MINRRVGKATTLADLLIMRLPVRDMSIPRQILVRVDAGRTKPAEIKEERRAQGDHDLQ